MTKRLCDALRRVLDQTGTDHRVLDDYSGRFMYGRTTHALVVDDPAVVYGALVLVGVETPADGLADLADDARKLKRDELGISFVWY